ncbi:MAG TPA: lipopolysaccharide biosynthesis protein [Polyangiales bacterium]|nr:lipopolysaccharide biosynthesis protein [Polyangiales bacterium]
MNDRPKQPGSSLVRGSVWTALRQGVQQACGLISLVVVARLIPPAEVGLFSMATLVLTITRALTETGFEQALIQRERLDDEVLDTGFCAVLVRGFLVALLLALAAGLFAAFFAEPRVADILRALSLGILIEGFINNRVAMFQRTLDFRRYFFFHATGQVFGLIATLVSAFLLHNVWAVVIGQLASATARVIASYVLCSEWPRLRMRWSLARDLLQYGRWVSASSVLLFILVNGDNVVIGKWIGAEALAFYNWAYQLANLPALVITQVLSSVMFPALAAVRGDRARVADLFARSMRLTLLMALPTSLLIAALVDVFTRALLGEKWLPIVPLTRALALFGLLRAIGASAGALFLAVGRPDVRAKLQIGQLLVFALSLYPLFRSYGVLGVAYSVTAYSVLNLPAAQFGLRLVELGPTALLRPALVTLIAAVSGACCAWLCAHGLEVYAAAPLIALIVAGLCGLGSTALMLLWLEPNGELAQSLRALRRLRRA